MSGLCYSCYSPICQLSLRERGNLLMTAAVSLLSGQDEHFEGNSLPKIFLPDRILTAVISDEEFGDTEMEHCSKNINTLRRLSMTIYI
jgi:hypothetical protein